MINQAFAEQFIRRIRSQTDYNINIMNEHGIILRRAVKSVWAPSTLPPSA